MKLPFSIIAALTAWVGASLLPPVFRDGNGQTLTGGQIKVGSSIHLINPDENAGGTIYYTLDGADPRHADIALGEPLVSFEDERSYHVPTSDDDGYLLTPPLSIPPIARYTFDEDGTDSAPAGGSQDAVLSFGTSVTKNALTSGALLLNRDNEHASLGDPAALQITGPISLSTWTYVTNLSKQDIQYLVVKGPDPDSGRSVFLRINHLTRHYEFGASDENGERLASFPIPDSDRSEWFHLAGVHDGTQWKLFHNGILVATKEDPIGAVQVPADWTIGTRAGADGDYLYGSIDEVHIFDQAITDADAASLFQTTIPLWTEPFYEPAISWNSGPGGHGYSFNEFVWTDVSPEMPGVSASIYTRAVFDIFEGELEFINHLELDVVYDDGFVAYLNGVEIHREHAPLVLHGQSEATLPHLPEDEMVTFNLEDHVDLLLNGTNVFAVQGLNNWIESDDFLIHTQLQAGLAEYSVASSATAYNAPFPLSRSTKINARVLKNGEWGPLATIDLQTPNIAVTKIHYNPKVDPEEDLFPASHYEYIEIQNIDNRPFSMIGLQLEGTVTATFTRSSLAPGQRYLIPNDTNAFFDHHPDFPGTIVYDFTGELPNGSGRIHLFNDAVGTIRDFEYGVESPAWPDEANGGGYCLVLIKPENNPDHSDPANWRRSVVPRGTPAESDAIPFSGIATADVDGDGLSALLEYTLGTSDSEANPTPWSFQYIGDTGDDGPDRFFQIEIPRRIGTDDAVWIPEFSTDLKSWSATPNDLELIRTPSPDHQWTIEQYRATQPISEDQHRFIRLRAESR